MRPYAPPNLILDRIWKEQEAKWHRNILQNIKSDLAQDKLKSRKQVITRNGGKRETLQEGKSNSY